MLPCLQKGEAHPGLMNICKQSSEGSSANMQTKHQHGGCNEEYTRVESIKQSPLATLH